MWNIVFELDYKASRIPELNIRQRTIVTVFGGNVETQV
jgi:hypothetical protein